MNARRLGTAIVSLVLILGTAPPAAAATGSLTITLAVTGYAPGTPTVPFGLFCDGQPDRQLFLDPGGSTNLTVEATDCHVGDIGGDAGDLAWWGEMDLPVVSVPAGGSATLAIVLERVYNGEDPQWDAFFQPSLSAFTIDRIELNRSGGLRVFGTLFCPAVEGTPFEGDNYLGMEMRLTQYVGRKTAVHATWSSDIAVRCFDPATPGTPVPWTTISSASTLPGMEWWIYGTDGRFASGDVLIEAGVSLGSYVATWWDEGSDTYAATCSTDWREDGFYDANGDGFCAYYTDSGARAQQTVKTDGARTGGGKRR
ncbi:MAG: hypothetical protein RL338_771 [Chloroflexota bacterium]|jgi:hypothetical protein